MAAHQWGSGQKLGGTPESPEHGKKRSPTYKPMKFFASAGRQDKIVKEARQKPDKKQSDIRAMLHKQPTGGMAAVPVASGSRSMAAPTASNSTGTGPEHSPTSSKALPAVAPNVAVDKPRFKPKLQSSIMFDSDDEVLHLPAPAPPRRLETGTSRLANLPYAAPLNPPEQAVDVNEVCSRHRAKYGSYVASCLDCRAQKKLTAYMEARECDRILMELSNDLDLYSSSIEEEDDMH